MKNIFGKLLSYAIQLWLYATGTRVDLNKDKWLQSPMGDAGKIGADFYHRFATKEHLLCTIDANNSGLIPNFDALNGQGFNAQTVQATIGDFYEHTADYQLEVWSQWFGIIAPFAKVLISSVSRQIEQLNIPLQPLETSRGMSSQIISLTNPITQKQVYACWLRKTRLSNQVVYAGFYSICQPPLHNNPCVKVVFPLPNGNATILLYPQRQADGSFKLLSEGKRIGETGYYRVHNLGNNRVAVRFIPLKECIHVYTDAEAVLRTNHTFTFWGKKFLELHYKITPKL